MRLNREHYSLPFFHGSPAPSHRKFSAPLCRRVKMPAGMRIANTSSEPKCRGVRMEGKPLKRIYRPGGVKRHARRKCLRQAYSRVKSSKPIKNAAGGSVRAPERLGRWVNAAAIARIREAVWRALVPRLYHLYAGVSQQGRRASPASSR